MRSPSSEAVGFRTPLAKEGSTCPRLCLGMNCYWRPPWPSARLGSGECNQGHTSRLHSLQLLSVSNITVPMISSHVFRNSAKRRGASFRMRFKVFCTACSIWKTHLAASRESRELSAAASRRSSSRRRRPSPPSPRSLVARRSRLSSVTVNSCRVGVSPVSSGFNFPGFGCRLKSEIVFVQTVYGAQKWGAKKFSQAHSK